MITKEQLIPVTLRPKAAQMLQNPHTSTLKHANYQATALSYSHIAFCIKQTRCSLDLLSCLDFVLLYDCFYFFRTSSDQ